QIGRASARAWNGAALSGCRNRGSRLHTDIHENGARDFSVVDSVQFPPYDSCNKIGPIRHKIFGPHELIHVLRELLADAALDNSGLAEAAFGHVAVDYLSSKILTNPGVRAHQPEIDIRRSPIFENETLHDCLSVN